MPLKPPGRSKGLLIACDTQTVPDAQGRRPKDVGLNGDSISVTRGHLHDRLDAFPPNNNGAGYGREPHDGRLVVGYVDCIRTVAKDICLLLDNIAIATHRRTKLGRYRKVSFAQHHFQV